MSVTLFYFYCQRLSLDRLVGFDRCVVIYKRHCRNSVFALVARHYKIVENHVALNAIGCKLCLVGNLGVVLFKVFREINHRLLYKLKIADASNHYTQSDGIAFLNRLFGKLCRYRELAYSTRECGWLRRKRIHLYVKSWCHNIALYLNITRTAIEESLKRVDRTVLLNHNALERDARDRQLTCHLREHYILAPCHTTIVLAIEPLKMKTLLLWQRHFLSVETCKVGHLAIERREIYKRIYLICKQHWFLLVYSALVGTHLYEKIACGNLTTTRATCLWSIVFVHLRCATCSTTCRARHRDAHSLRGNSLTSHFGMGSRNSIRSCLIGIERIGVGYRRRTTRMTIDKLVARLLRSVWTGYHLKSRRHITCSEAIYILGVDSI